MNSYTATRPQRYIPNNRIMNFNESRIMPRQTQTKRNAMPKKKNKLMNSIVFLFLELVILIVIGTQVFKILTKKSNVEIAAELEIPSWIDVQLIDEGNPSRSGALLEGINDIVVHYVGNPRTTAQQNRDFYNQEDSDVCSHFVVGIDGEIIMCVPLTEKSASSNDRNRDTISIEVCHPDITGEFTDASYESLIKLVNWLRSSFNLSTDHVIRHYEVTGKECPMYFVRNPEKWDQFKEDLKAAEEGKPISYKFSGEGSEEESDELSMDDADDFTADNVDYATDEYQNDDLVYAIDDYNNYNYDEYPVEAPDEVYY